MKNLITLLLAAFALPALAEGGCPSGHHPQNGQGWQACVPMETDNRTTTCPTPHWETRWGSMATDNDMAVLGTAFGAPTRAAAEAQAVKDCRRQGGLDCRPRIASGNTCLAKAVGRKTSSYATGQKIEIAEERALAECRRSDERCQIYHSFCSMAELVP